MIGPGLPPEARAAAAHVFVDDLADGSLGLGEDDTHHLGRVLRLRDGEQVSAADGRGGWRACRWDGHGSLVADGPVVAVGAPSPTLTVAMAVPKGDRADWAVQKLTEVGADRIVPLLTDRGVVRLRGERAARQVARWRGIARQAAMQSRCARIPVVADLTTPADLIAGLPDAAEAVLAEPGGAPPDPARSTLLIGPEGGWSPAELDLAAGRIGLGGTVLRTETAAIVAATLFVALRAA